MLKSSLSVAVYAALAALVLKLGVFAMDAQHGGMERYIFMIYMLIMLVAVFFGIRQFKIKSESTTTYQQDFKAGLSVATYFAIIVGVFTYYYYSRIDPDFFEIKYTENIKPFEEDVMQKAIAYKEAMTKDLPAQKMQEIVAAKEKAIEGYKNYYIGSRIMFTPTQQFTLTLMWLMFLGLIYSAMTAFFIRKFPGYKK